MVDSSTDNRYRIGKLERKVKELQELTNNGYEAIETSQKIMSETLLGLKARLDKLDRLEKLMLYMESRIAVVEKNLNLAFETINNHEGS